jgi:hypothetical protein
MKLEGQGEQGGNLGLFLLLQSCQFGQKIMTVATPTFLED